MSNKKFTNEEINLLSMNKYVLRVNQKGITYSNEFKMHFIAEYSKGKTTRVIFEESGFDIDILGEDRIRSAGNRWRSAYKTNGVTG
ncbi:HTH domain-containing protein, partial [Clostridium butyricum]